MFVTGQSLGVGTSNDYATVAYDAATGEELWSGRYDGPANGADLAWGIDVNPDRSRVFITGQSLGVGTSDDYATVAYDADTGSDLWVGRYNGPPGNSGDVARAMGVSADGSRVFVTGQSPGVGTNSDYATVAYDSVDGSELWVGRFSGPVLATDSFDTASELGLSPDGSRVFVSGQSLGIGTDIDFATVAYDSTDGRELWVGRYNGPGSGADVVEALDVSPDGSRLFVTGRDLGIDTSFDYATVAYRNDS